MKWSGRESRRKTYKGSVLFTVLVVMVVMLILTMATISLASEASKRAYANYNDHQTTSTARSVVDSVIEALKEDENKELAISILDNVESAGEEGVTVDVFYGGNSNLGDGLGTVESLVFTYIGKDKEGSPSDKCFNITGSGKDIIKVTATVVQGGVTNTYSQYVIGERLKTIRSSSGGGLIALGGYSGSGSPQLHAMSPAYIGIADDFDIYDNTKNSTLVNFTDDTKMNSALINSSFKLNTNPFVYLTKGDGISVMGNFDQYNTFKITTNFTPEKTDALKDYPYVYVKGAYKLGGILQAGSNSNPVNIYCGRFLYDTSGQIDDSNVNIYCYNTENTLTRPKMYDNSDLANYAKSSWSQLGNSANSSKLIDWASGSFTKKFSTGNFCTKGNLYMQGKVNISGDIYVGGDLYIGEFAKDPVVGGNIYVNGKVRILSGKLDSRCKKLDHKIYCNGDIKYYNAGVEDDSDGDAVDLLFTSRGSDAQKKNDYETNEAGDIVNDEKGDPKPNPSAKFVVFNISGESLPETVTVFSSSSGDVGDLSEVVLTTDGVKKSMYDDKGDYKDALNKSEGMISGGKYYVYKGGNSGEVSAATINGTPAVSGIIGDNHTTIVDSVEYKYKAKIIESCMITGSFQNVNFYVEPASATDKIWINLHNAVFTNCNFIIDDSKAEVIFYLPTEDGQINGGEIGAAEAISKYNKLISGADSSYSAYKNYVHFKGDTVVMSERYLEHLLTDTSLDIKKFPLKDKDTSNDWMLPNISICAADKANVLYETSDGEFTLTGDVCIPGGTVDVYKGGFSPTDKYITNSGIKYKYPSDFRYEGLTIDKPVGCFGSIIAGSFKQLCNEFDTYYIDNPADNEPTKTGDGGYAWAPIPGYAYF